MRTLMRRRRAQVAVALVVAAATASCGSHDRMKEAQYCAIMNDGVGLYVGNPVTQMGYPIGKVTAIAPSNSAVRVTFTLNGRRLPTDVRAIIRSTSILADRALELVGNYQSGPSLAAGGCIPLDRTSTPRSLSEVVGSATRFLKTMTPDGQTNVGAVVNGLDQALHGTGPGLNRLLTTASSVLDAPDHAIGDLGSIITNLGELTTALREIRGPLKQLLLDAQQTMPEVARVNAAGNKTTDALVPVVDMVSDLERELGSEFQQTFDVSEVALRKASAHSTLLATLMQPVPFLINGVANVVNNKQFNIRYRPPLYRIRTPDGLLTCGAMNASMPGSCADVAGTPYAVDVALLQYVLTQASR